MARGRFISAKISESEQFADLETHEARLMFLMMLPHADVEGRLKADVRYLSGKIFTYLDLSRQQIESGLADLERAELIRMYSVKGRRYLYFPKFSEHQIGLRKDREQESEIPSPEDADSEEAPSETNNPEGSTEIRSDSGVTPDYVPPKIKGEEEVKEKGSSGAHRSNSEKAYGAVAYASSHYVAEWLRDSRSFDFERAYDIWGDQLEDLWKSAVAAENRKPGDQAKFRFQDACEGTLDLG